MATKIKLEPTTGSLTIGDDYAETNTVTFKIVLTGDGPVWLTLKIPVGADGVLRQPEDANDLVVETPGTDPRPKLVDKNKKWSLGDYDSGVQVSGSTELSVSISNILCRASEGDSEITITAATETATDSKALTIEKAKPTTPPKNPILYFIAEPTYLIGSGEVALRWAVAGDEDDVTLDTPTQKKWKQDQDASSTTDNPSTTFAYTLRVKGKQRQVTVNVLQAGWHELYPLRKPQADGSVAFPSVIFDAAGRTDSTPGAALYAIFVRGPDRKAVLCKSADGITGWQVINEAVPERMESSPGVQLGNRLWLIGGSAVDPKEISNRICYYDLDCGSGWQDAHVTGFDDGARMGHACVIVDDNTIWVLGGLGKPANKCRNDVWSLAIDGDAVSATPVPDTPHIWSPRCMFSAVNFNNMIWVCGGVDSPIGGPLGDLWATESRHVVWKERPTGEKGSVVANAIGTGAAACGDILFTLITSRTGGPNWQLGSEMWTIGKSGIMETSDSWVKSGQQPEVPNNLSSTPHSIAVVGFRNRLYFRRLYRDDMQGKVVGAPLYVYIKS